MKDESKSKKIRHIAFFIHFMCYFLMLVITNMFDKSIQLFVHNINIFSNVSDELIRGVYLFPICCIIEKVYQKNIQYFNKKYNV